MANRQAMLDMLNRLKPGISRKEVLEHSDCLLFHEDKVRAFNGEILASIPNEYGLVGAVPADGFYNLLARLPEDEVEVAVAGEEILITGKKKKAGLSCYANPPSTWEEVPAPKKRKAVDETLMATLIQAARICSKNESNVLTGYVHITPEMVEATDGFQMFRATMATPFPGSVLLPADSILSIASEGMTKASFGEGWVATESKSGVEYSLRCAEAEYFPEANLTDILACKGDKVTLPENLPEILKRASVMEGRSEGSGQRMVRLSLKENLLVVRTQNESGWYEERRKVEWAGAEITFTVNPDFLLALLSRSNVITLSKSKMKITQGPVQYVVCLEGE